MKPRNAVARCTTGRERLIGSRRRKPTLEGEIAQMGDLDVKGLRLRWQSMFRRQAPSHLPRHLLLAVQHSSFTVGACVFWHYAFALRRISRLVSRLRGDFLLVE
jgi:hypothetical protein